MAPDFDAISRQGVPPRGGVNPIDTHVGGRVRLRRAMLGLTQDAVADALGLSSRIVDGYEEGSRGICAKRLLELARILDVPVSFFFDEMPETVKHTIPRPITTAHQGPPTPSAMTTSGGRDVLELVRTYYDITDPLRRWTVRALARRLSSFQAIRDPN